MSNRLDVSKLIVEVEKRPILWDTQWVQHRVRGSLNVPWQEVAQALGTKVEQCKRKWKNLRDAYRAEIRRVARRRERSRLMGNYDPSTDYESKWLYFEPMSFINQSKRRRIDVTDNSQDYDATTNSSFDNNDQYNVELHHLNDIKSEPITIAFDVDNDNDNNIGLDNANNVHVNDNDDEDIANDIDKANDKLFKQFQSMATPQAARRVSASLTMGNGHMLSYHLGNKQNNHNRQLTSAANKSSAKGNNKSSSSNSYVKVNSNIKAIGAANPVTATTATAITTTTTTATTITTTTTTATATATIAITDTTAPTVTATASTGVKEGPCKCKAEQKDQIHFLENLEREERKLMNSTRHDICRSQQINHVGDGDYNFLVSFLSQMKKMTEYQNLQFRAKMCGLVLTIMTPTATSTPTGAPHAVHHLGHSLGQCNSTSPSTIAGAITKINMPAICCSNDVCPSKQPFTSQTITESNAYDNTASSTTFLPLS